MCLSSTLVVAILTCLSKVSRETSLKWRQSMVIAILVVRTLTKYSSSFAWTSSRGRQALTSRVMLVLCVVSEPSASRPREFFLLHFRLKFVARVLQKVWTSTPTFLVPSSKSYAGSNSISVCQSLRKWLLTPTSPSPKLTKLSLLVVPLVSPESNKCSKTSLTASSSTNLSTLMKL